MITDEPSTTISSTMPTTIARIGRRILLNDLAGPVAFVENEHDLSGPGVDRVDGDGVAAGGFPVGPEQIT